MWWQWCLGLVGLLLFAAYSLALVLVTAKVARGEKLELRKLPPPAPSVDSVQSANEKIRRMKQDSVERNARILE